MNEDYTVSKSKKIIYKNTRYTYFLIASLISKCRFDFIPLDINFEINRTMRPRACTLCSESNRMPLQQTKIYCNSANLRYYHE